MSHPEYTLLQFSVFDCYCKENIGPSINPALDGMIACIFMQDIKNT